MAAVILDTDIGYDADDMYALLLMLNSDETSLDLVITGDEVDGKRAQFTKKVLDMCGKPNITVIQGEDLGNKDFVIDELLGYGRYDLSTDYLTATKELLDQNQEVIYINIQGCSNLAKILEAIPEAKHKMKIYQMGGSIDGFAEHNFKLDPVAADYVLRSGADIKLVMAQTTFNPVLQIHNKHRIYQRLKASHNEVHQMLARHTELFNERKKLFPYMHDPLTVAEAMGKEFIKYFQSAAGVDDIGRTFLYETGPKLDLSYRKSKANEFMRFLEKRLFSD
ncbi:nucleoside hydrolase [Candidatus Woesearchaeota archaeon]|nr:nucleoside hydrolase [Candidatus Woesearchaeota archaeon]MBT6040445.1 nucleoside hydrolase [Candidatus Woesearchaeota archaeon]